MPTQERLIGERVKQANLLVLFLETCPEELRQELRQRILVERMINLNPLLTYTQRPIFQLRIKDEWLGFIKVKNPFEEVRGRERYAQESVINELRAGLKLKQVVAGMEPFNWEIEGRRVRVAFDTEDPLGAIINLESGERAVIYQGRSGESGEIFNRLDPPIKGAIFYNRQLWQMAEAIDRGLREISERAKEIGLLTEDLGLHQTVYEWKGNSRLRVTVIDSDQYLLVEP